MHYEIKHHLQVKTVQKVINKYVGGFDMVDVEHLAFIHITFKSLYLRIVK